MGCWEPGDGPLRATYTNALWQLDFMGHLPLGAGRLHPLSLLDDHARFAVGLWACGCKQRTAVQQALTAAFVPAHLFPLSPVGTDRYLDDITQESPEMIM
jgi:hypothetical protein